MNDLTIVVNTNRCCLGLKFLRKRPETLTPSPKCDWERKQVFQDPDEKDGVITDIDLNGSPCLCRPVTILETGECWRCSLLYSLAQMSLVAWTCNVAFERLAEFGDSTQI